ncbi:fatty acid-binding protein 10-A, liver basic-like [Glandiceps talaboti]
MAFAGTWTFVKGENMKEFILASGGKPEVAEIGDTLATTIVCAKDGDYFSVKITGPKGNTVEQKFKPGEPFEENLEIFGKKRQSVASIDGGKLVIKGVEAGQAVETREVNGDEMVLSMTKDGVSVVGKRYFKRA